MLVFKVVMVDIMVVVQEPSVTVEEELLIFALIKLYMVEFLLQLEVVLMEPEDTPEEQLDLPLD